MYNTQEQKDKRRENGVAANHCSIPPPFPSLWSMDGLGLRDRQLLRKRLLDCCLWGGTITLIDLSIRSPALSALQQIHTHCCARIMSPPNKIRHTIATYREQFSINCGKCGIVRHTFVSSTFLEMTPEHMSGLQNTCVCYLVSIEAYACVESVSPYVLWTVSKWLVNIVICQVNLRVYGRVGQISTKSVYLKR